MHSITKTTHNYQLLTRTRGKDVHITLLDVFIRVLVNAIRLPALAKLRKKPAHRHPRLIKLMQKPAGIPLHTQPAQPMPAHRLPVVLPRLLILRRSGRRRRLHAIAHRRGLLPRHPSTLRCPPRGHGRLQAPLEIKAEASIGVLHR
jgi:hypothetical protein